MGVVVQTSRHEQAIADRSSEARDEPTLDPLMTDVPWVRRRTHAQRHVRLRKVRKLVADRAQMVSLQITTHEASGIMLTMHRGAVQKILLVELTPRTDGRTQPCE